MGTKEKYCSDCKRTLGIDSFFRKKRTYKDKVYYDHRHICKKCSNEKNKEFCKKRTIKNIKFCECGNRIHHKKLNKCPVCNIPHKKERAKLYMRKIRNSKIYKKNNLGWMTESQYKRYKAKKMQIYRRRKPEIINAIQKRSYTRDRDQLTDTYIKGIIQGHTGVSFKVIPKKMIELQRAVTTLKRTLKERKPLWTL